MAVVWSEIGFLSLQQQWLQASIRFWNQVAVLPVGDLHRDLMYRSCIACRSRALSFDSLQAAVTHGPLNKGFVKGLTEQCAQIGFSLADLGLFIFCHVFFVRLRERERERLHYPHLATTMS